MGVPWVPEFYTPIACVEIPRAEIDEVGRPCQPDRTTSPNAKTTPPFHTSCRKERSIYKFRRFN